MDKKKHFDSLRRHREHLSRVFHEIDVIDPVGLSLSVETPDRQPPQYTALLKRKPAHVDLHYVFDIETWGSDPSRLDFGMIADIHGQMISYQGSDVLDTWDKVFHAIELLIPEGNNPTTGKGWTIKLWAHNGAKFDAAGLSRKLISNVHKMARPCLVINPDLDARKRYIKRGIEYFAIKEELIPILSLESHDDIDAFLLEVSQKYRDNWSLYEQIMELGQREYIEEWSSEYEQGVFRGSRSIIRKHGRKKYEWSFMPLGHSYAIEIKRGNSTLRIVDSLEIIKSPLADMGAKGVTPIRNINPMRWLIDEYESGRLQYDPRWKFEEAYQYWKNARSEDDEEYCRQDVKILARALSDFSEVFRELRPNHHDLNDIEALDFNTITQLGAFLRNVMFVHDQRPSIMKRTNPHQVFYKPQIWLQNGRKGSSAGMDKKPVESVEEMISIIKQKNERGVDIPYRIWSYPIYDRNINNFYNFPVFYQNGVNIHAYNHCTYGGSTVVYMPNTPINHRIMRLDVTNMYGSIQSLPEYPFVNPELLRTLRSLGFPLGISGKENILSFINDNNGKPLLGGVVQIKINRILGDTFKKFPLIPGHMHNSDFHEQTVFADHGERYMRIILVEELRYILENADILDDDVQIMPDNSYFAPYMKYKPTTHFINKIFNYRDAAKKRGEEFKSKLYKLIQNASYGELLQTITVTTDLNSSDIPGILSAIEELRLHQPFWLDWDKVDVSIANKPILLPDHEDYESANEKYAITLMDHVRKFLSDNFLDLDPQIFVDDRGDNRLIYRMASGVSQEAIKAWGSVIPAYGRIMLHKACLIANKAGYEVAYTDTDCIDIVVPNEIPDEVVINNLIANGLNVGDRLGQWEYEPFKAEKKLMIEGADVDENLVINNPRVVYLAAKHYAVYDQNFNVLKVVVKGIQSNNLKQRCAGIAIILSKYSAKNRKGGINRLSSIHYSDSLRNISAKRHYPSMYEVSKPIVLRNPTSISIDALRRIEVKNGYEFAVEDKNGALIPTWEEYIREINKFEVDETGLVEARDFYCNQLHFKRKTYSDLLDEINAVKDMYDNLKTKGYLRNLTADDVYTEIRRVIEFNEGLEPSSDEIIENINNLFVS